MFSGGSVSFPTTFFWILYAILAISLPNIIDLELHVSVIHYTRHNILEQTCRKGKRERDLFSQKQLSNHRYIDVQLLLLRLCI